MVKLPFSCKSVVFMRYELRSIICDDCVWHAMSCEVLLCQLHNDFRSGVPSDAVNLPVVTVMIYSDQVVISLASAYRVIQITSHNRGYVKSGTLVSGIIFHMRSVFYWMVRDLRVPPKFFPFQKSTFISHQNLTSYST